MQQKVIDELNEMTEFTGDYLDNHVKESLEWSKENHDLQVVELSDAEALKWDEKLRELQTDSVKKFEEEGLPAEEYLKKMEELIKKYNEES